MTKEGFDYVQLAPVEDTQTAPIVFGGEDEIGLVDRLQAETSGYQDPPYIADYGG
jgi:hypothetical protein